MPVRSRYVDSRYFILGFLYWVIFTVRDFLTQDVFKPTYLLRCWESNPTQACFLRKHMTYLESIIKIADFLLKKKLFEIYCKFYQHISGTAIGNKFSPPYAYIFMNYIETEWLWKRNLIETLVMEKTHWWYLLYLGRI